MLVLPVERGQLRPVDARLEVMHGVVAVVEEERVEQRRDEVPRMVPFAFRVGFDVLQVVHALDQEERHLLGNDEEEQRLAPVQHEEEAHGAEEDDVLGGRRPESGAVPPVEILQEELDVARLREIG